MSGLEMVVVLVVIAGAIALLRLLTRALSAVLRWVLPLAIPAVAVVALWHYGALDWAHEQIAAMGA